MVSKFLVNKGPCCPVQIPNLADPLLCSTQVRPCYASRYVELVIMPVSAQLCLGSYEEYYRPPPATDTRSDDELVARDMTVDGSETSLTPHPSS